MKRISVIFGTRPEAIKLSPIILALKKIPEIECRVCVTAQHRQLLDHVLHAFSIVPDMDLNLMRPNQTLSELTARAISALDKYFSAEKTDLVLVQGDTTTVFCTALAAFYHQIPIGHVEAGLRTWEKYSPFPEEVNRVLATRLADMHFAPTEVSKANLIKEGIAPEKIYVTGNTVIDALYMAVEKVNAVHPNIPGLAPEIIANGLPLVLITGHRRENFGKRFEGICEAISELSRRFPSTAFVYPVHLNPNVQEPVSRLLGNLRNVYLIKPLNYLAFVFLMSRATLVLTDSGGVQEEAPSLGKPVLVMRDTTERPEAVSLGKVRLVGADVTSIVNGVSTLLTDENAYRSMASAVNPYGDGKATSRILAACMQFFQDQDIKR